MEREGGGCAERLLEAEVLVGLATDTTVYLSRRGEALKVKKLTFTIRASDSSWHPGLPGRPLFPESATNRRTEGPSSCFDSGKVVFLSQSGNENYYTDALISSYTKVYSVIYDSGSVPEQSIFSPCETSPTLRPTNPESIITSKTQLSSNCGWKWETFPQESATNRRTERPQFENKYFTEMCSGSVAGSYLRLIDFVYHATLGLRVIKKRRITCRHGNGVCAPPAREVIANGLFLFPSFDFQLRPIQIRVQGSGSRV